MNLSIIIEAIDRVTAPARAIAGRLRSSLDGLGLPRIQAALGGVVGGLGRVVGEAARLGRALLASSAVAGGALGAMALSATGAGAAARRAAASVGVSVEQYQRLSYAAGQAGVESDQLRDLLQELGVKVIEAGDGNEELATTFRDMGVDLRDAEGRLRSVDQILLQVSDAFARAPDGPRKTAVAMQLLGGEGAKAIPLLNRGADALRRTGDEAERLGLVISGGTAAQMEGFHASLDRLRGLVVGLRNTVAEQLIPVIAPLLERFVAWATANREVIATRIVEWVKTIPPVVEALAARITALYDALQPVSGWLASAVDYIGPFNAALTALGVLIVGKTIVALVTLGGALVTLGGVLLATPIGWFLGAVALLAGAAYLIWRNWEPIAAWFSGLWQQLQAGGAAFVAWMEGSFLAGWEALAGAVMAVWQPVEAWASRLWAAVRTVFEGFTGFVNGAFTGDLTGAFAGLIQAGQGVRDYFVAFWRPAIDGFAAFVGWIDGTFAGRLSAAIDGAWQAIRPIVETITGALDRVMGAAGRIAGIGRSISGGIADAAGGILSRASSLIGLSSPASAEEPGAAAAPIGAAAVPIATQRVDTSGVVTFKVDQDGRARVTDVRPANPDQEWRVERGLSLGAVP